MVNLKQRYAVPRVSTRGYFDLRTGKLKDGKFFDYYLYPKYKFKKILKQPEIVIFVHGMRNTRKGCVMGTNALRRKLRSLGYKHPVIGFSYDADIRGAYKLDDEACSLETYHDILDVASEIARQNTRNLFAFIRDLYYRKHYKGKVRLVGHSLGCEIVLGVLEQFEHREIGYVESVHLFGAPVDKAYLSNNFKYVEKYLDGKLVNYYCPTDEVIREAVNKGELKTAIALEKVGEVISKKIKQKRIFAKHHGFKAYMKGLRSFP